MDTTATTQPPKTEEGIGLEADAHEAVFAPMKEPFPFAGIYTLDMANNHEGSLEHGLNIISEMGKVVRKHGVRAAMKFQFRDFGSLIHPDHLENSDNKHIPRFLKNALTRDDYAVMTQAIRDAGMITMSTPFDEPSMELIEALDIELVKVASCSADDWPLLEKIAEYNRPVVVSTGGLTHEMIDNLASFFGHRAMDFAIMHCVSIYPTPADALQLNQIAAIKARHPDRTVGWSTHEDPDDLHPVIAATAIGAEVMERHVGLATDGRQLNKYSSTPEQVDAWIEAGEKAKAMLGSSTRPPTPKEEGDALLTLKRGVFAKRPLKAGRTLTRDDVFFAMPVEKGQWTSGSWREGIELKTAIEKNGSIMETAVDLPPPHEDTTLIHAIHDIKAMMNEAKIALPVDFALEFSHHYGKERFREVGAVLIDCINREYCKKLIVQLPGQDHPLHCHKKKEESFQVLHGELDVNISGRQYSLVAGDIMVVPRGAWHSFGTKTGVIFEEISTTHYNNDSFYQDKAINRMERSERKTMVQRWGDYQWR